MAFGLQHTNDVLDFGANYGAHVRPEPAHQEALHALMVDKSIGLSGLSLAGFAELDARPAASYKDPMQTQALAKAAQPDLKYNNYFEEMVLAAKEDMSGYWGTPSKPVASNKPAATDMVADLASSFVGSMADGLTGSKPAAPTVSMAGLNPEEIKVNTGALSQSFGHQAADATKPEMDAKPDPLAQYAARRRNPDLNNS